MHSHSLQLFLNEIILFVLQHVREYYSIKKYRACVRSILELRPRNSLTTIYSELYISNDVNLNDTQVKTIISIYTSNDK